MMLPEVDPSAVSGNIIAAGSSTVYPLSEALAQRFQEEGFTEDKGKITIESHRLRRWLRALLQSRRNRYRQRQPQDQARRNR